MNQVLTFLKQTFFSRPILAIVIGFACVGQSLSAPLAVGELAPDFSLQQLDGEGFNLSDYRGKRAVYLIFWNTWCGPCMKKASHLVDIQSEYGEQAKLLAVNTSWSDSLAEIAQFQSRFSTNYAIAFDDNAEVTHRFGVMGTPTSFLVDINGVIRQVDGITDTLSANITEWNRVNSKVESLVNTSCSKERTC
ncbi:peroxiredoxin [Shewanella sp. UCD-KL12]|uniref:peroxiredoxin family protein n=1 Tax=Shewanella sp. UCD-KL12 TaxID=1917163 RepID=UPI000970ECD3|nr:TlpA disulfide reductase family protein [Shewanella sp. UCD-KL12]